MDRLSYKNYHVTPFQRLTLSRGPPPLKEELDGKDSCPCLPDCHCVVGILTFGTRLGIICEQTWDLGPMGGGAIKSVWINFKPYLVPFFYISNITTPFVKT